jgi:arginyl-tRNA synthetase
MTPLQKLQARFREVLSAYTTQADRYASMIKPTQDARHGDYQANCAMPLAKELNRKPRELAQQLADKLDLNDVIETAEVAGPGFINLRLRTPWLADQVRRMAGDDRLGVAPAAPPRTILIDYSSPNVAKPMHVGHLRSTIIGDALARLFRFLGHHVVSDNHLGDWGTQIGMLLYGYKHFRDDEGLRQDPVREMARLYVHVRGLMKGDEGEGEEAAANPITQAVRRETALLHAGDPTNCDLWKMFMPWCRTEIETIYRRLDVHLDVTHGESFYQPMLADVVRDLEAKVIARPTEGAIGIFLAEDEPPALIRKRDGAYTYTTTDLATIRYRMDHWRPEVILYVVGAPQALHFKNLFAIARRWGYDSVALEHISFGSVLGPDRRPFKTREGGVVELVALLDEAVERARQVYEQMRAERDARGEELPELTSEELGNLVEVVGIGAVKYADLNQNRTSDYVFNWDKMLAMEGNTAAYMQYTYARIRSIFRKGDVDENALVAAHPPVIVEHPAERALAVQLLRFGDALDAAVAEHKPSLVTAYLWDLAKTYSGFYQNCPVLRAETSELRQSRLLLCHLAARVIHQSLGLLGIQTVERM